MLIFYVHVTFLQWTHRIRIGTYIVLCRFCVISCLGLISAWARFIHGALIKASFSHPAGTHAQRMWIGVWCYFPGWVNCLWGTVLSLWLQSDFAVLHNGAVGPWYGSNEELWRAGCLLASCRGTREDAEGWKYIQRRAESEKKVGDGKEVDGR